MNGRFFRFGRFALDFDLVRRGEIAMAKPAASSFAAASLVARPDVAIGSTAHADRRLQAPRPIEASQRKRAKMGCERRFDVPFLVGIVDSRSRNWPSCLREKSQLNRAVADAAMCK